MDGRRREAILRGPQGRRVSAAFASAVVPGSGQMLLGQRRLGLMFLVAFLLPVAALCLFGAGRSYVGYLSCTVWILIVCLGSGTALLRRRSRMLEFVWLAGVLGLALLSTRVWVNGSMWVGGLRPYRVGSASMERTFYAGDTILTDERAYRHQAAARGDVIAFEHDGNVLAKRLIGLGGDRISSRDGVIFVNDQELDEPYANHDSTLTLGVDDFADYVVPAGQVYVLGDSRNGSLDSRMREFGQLRLEDIRGKVLYVLSSKNGRSGAEVR